MYNYTNEDWRDLAIGEVLRAPVFKRQEIIRSHRELLKDVDFIYVDEQHGQDLIESVLDMFGIGNERMCSVFYSNKLQIMNLDILNGKKSGCYISYDIGMETQIVSYITRFISGTLDKELNQVVAPLQIKRTLPSEINVDAYALENCGIDKEFSSIESQSIWSVFYFYNLPMMEASMSASCADVSLREIRNFIKYSKMTDKYVERYYLCYSFLLKIVILHFDNNSIRDKLIELIKFENEDVCTLDMMFINIAEAFWKQGTKLRFFGKVQKGRKNIVDVLKNMAWDLFHWVHTSLNFNHSLNYDSDISIPLIYSIDKRFLELTEYAKMDGVAVDNRSKIAHPHYKQDLLDDYFSYEEQVHYLGADSLHKRNQNRRNVDTTELCRKLEQQLLATGLF